MSLAIVAALTAPAAWAQETPAADAQDREDTPPVSSAEAEPKSLDRITVTGSRISRAGFDTLEPAQVIEREQIEQLGVTNVAESLFRIPGFGAGASYRGDQAGFGTGVNFISRFGMGSNRELTLVNGRRFVSSNPPTQFGPDEGGLQVDLNAIPTALIQRVESIGIGGAPTYGSDAITGVSNIILRKDFEGAEATMGFGATGHGDNVRFNLSSTYGRNFAEGRGNFTISVAHDRNNGVMANARAFYRQNYALADNPNAATMARWMPGRNPASDGRVNGAIPFNTSPSDGIPGRVYIRDRVYSGITFGGLLLPADRGVIKNPAGELAGFGPGADQYFQFDNGGNLVKFTPGTPFGTGAQASGGDGFRINDTAQLISDLNRSNVFATGNFALNDNVNLFAELSGFKSEARELVDQSAYNGIYFGGESGALVFSIDNPFLKEADRATLQSLGVSEFLLSRASRDLVENNASAHSTIKRVVVGADGYFDIGTRQAEWEVSLNHGRGDFSYASTSLISQNFTNAINVRRDASGQIVCDSSIEGTTADPACVPLNLFGENQASAAAKAYVTHAGVARAANRQTVFNANLTLGLFDLPGGEFKVNAGYEQRHEKGSFTPDAFQQAGLGRSVPVDPISGKFRTREVFMEAFAPVFGGAASYPGLRRLDLTLKGRRVDNSLAGLFNAYTYGLQYEPFEGFQLRGNKTRSFRAPAIVELFQPVASAFFAIPEACTSSNINGGSNPAVRQRNCEAFFAAYPSVDPASFTANAGTQRGTSGGNLNLRNEQADSWTAGFVYQPAFARGLTIAADWYDIHLTDAITSLSAAQIVSACFDNPQFNTADPNNGNAYCSMIQRDPETARANGIATTRINGPVLDFRGWTGEVRYSTDLARWGLDDSRLSLGFSGYFPKTLQEQVTPVVRPDEAIGEYGYSKRQYQWSAAMSHRHWSYGLVASYHSSTISDVQAGNLADQRDFIKMPSYTLWDAHVGYAFSQNIRSNLAVMNLRDDLGPFPFVVDGLGRRYMLTTTFRF